MIRGLKASVTLRFHCKYIDHSWIATTVVPTWSLNTDPIQDISFHWDILSSKDSCMVRNILRSLYCAREY